MKKNTKRKSYKHLYIAKEYHDPSYLQEELSRQQQYTKPCRKECMYKRQNVHKINSSKSDICNTEHNITCIQQRDSRDINTLGHVPQRGEKPVTIKQSNITIKKRKKQSSLTPKIPDVKEAENTRTETANTKKDYMRPTILHNMENIIQMLHVQPINLCYTMNQTIQIPVGLKVH